MIYIPFQQNPRECQIWQMLQKHPLQTSNCKQSQQTSNCKQSISTSNSFTQLPPTGKLTEASEASSANIQFETEHVDRQLIHTTSVNRQIELADRHNKRKIELDKMQNEHADGRGWPPRVPANFIFFQKNLAGRLSCRTSKIRVVIWQDRATKISPRLFLISPPPQRQSDSPPNLSRPWEDIRPLAWWISELSRC